MVDYDGHTEGTIWTDWLEHVLGWSTWLIGARDIIGRLDSSDLAVIWLVLSLVWSMKWRNHEPDLVALHCVCVCVCASVCLCLCCCLPVSVLQSVIQSGLVDMTWLSTVRDQGHDNASLRGFIHTSRLLPLDMNTFALLPPWLCYVFWLVLSSVAVTMVMSLSIKQKSSISKSSQLWQSSLSARDLRLLSPVSTLTNPGRRCLHQVFLYGHHGSPALSVNIPLENVYISVNE